MENKKTYHICLVEDEKNLISVLKAYLQREGWRVSVFTSGEESLANNPEVVNLWILDIMLPGIDGLSLLKKIREKDPEVPIIFISARDTDIDKIIGLETGGDDYLAKPFLPQELVIRVKRILQRAYSGDRTDSLDSLLKFNTYTLDSKKRLVSNSKGENIDLTSREFDILNIFAGHRGTALSREKIIELLYSDNYYCSDRIVDDLVRRIRRKMAEIRIETIYGYGYRMMLE